MPPEAPVTTTPLPARPVCMRASVVAPRGDARRASVRARAAPLHLLAEAMRYKPSPVRVHVISDMEGVGGIVNGSQTNAGEPLYEEGRRLYTEEINAAVRGAFSAGATDVCVMDHHGAGKGFSFNSLIADQLDARCEYVVQSDWTEYTGFLEEGCDACLLVGMHAMAGAPTGVMAHTVSGPDYQNLWFNGTLVGETGINAALCGHWGAPVLLVTGDRATCEEGESLLGSGLRTIAVKEGIG